MFGFTLTPKIKEKAEEIANNMIGGDKVVSEFIPFESVKLFIVKDGTAEAEERKNGDHVIGIIDVSGKQFLITDF